tara:strand:+ start:896 stop:1147 length:252 start_codon:yes stop_codon:yes gene_type:complete
MMSGHAELLEKFSNGKCSARQEMRGDQFEDAIRRGLRWYPRVAGENVQPSDPRGFPSRGEAIKDAQAFKQKCKAAILSRAGDA